MVHLIVHCEAEQGSQEWIEARRTGVGSTDSAAIMGLSKWRTPIEVWKEKLGIAEPFVTNWHMQRGHALEPLIRAHYAQQTGRDVYNMRGSVMHPERMYMFASLDGYTQDNRLCEFKAPTTKRGWGDAGTDEIPTEYLIQVQHAMFVTGIEVADIGASFGGAEPVYYEVVADKEIQAAIVDAAADFYFERVQKRVEPSPTTIEEMQQRLKIHDGAGVYATQEAKQAYERLLHIRADVKELDVARAEQEEAIKRFLLESGASILLDDSNSQLLSWNEQKGRESFDSASFKKAHPDLYAQFVKQGNPFRVLRIKGE